MSKASSALLVLAACGSHAMPTGGPVLAQALTAALAASDHAKAPWRCAAADTPTIPDEKLAGWQLGGHALKREGAAGELAIGVVADAAGAAAPTIAALGRLRARFDGAHVDVVLALGGMGATPAELEATLGTLADRASYPVVALAGDLEPAGAHAAAVAALHQKGDPIADGRLVRWIDAPGAAIALVPGAGAPARLVAGADGCGWRDSDIAALATELAARPALRIAASAEPPRSAASGVLALAMPGIDVHLHGPTTTEPTRTLSGTRDGKAIPLTPGTADATTRLPDPHHPSAGLLVIHGTTWKWTPLVDTTR